MTYVFILSFQFEIVSNLFPCYRCVENNIILRSKNKGNFGFKNTRASNINGSSKKKKRLHSIQLVNLQIKPSVIIGGNCCQRTFKTKNIFIQFDIKSWHYLCTCIEIVKRLHCWWDSGKIKANFSYWYRETNQNEDHYTIDLMKMLAK